MGAHQIWTGWRDKWRAAGNAGCQHSMPPTIRECWVWYGMASPLYRCSDQMKMEANGCQRMFWRRFRRGGAPLTTYRDPQTWLGLRLSGMFLETHSLNSPGVVSVPQLHNAAHEQVIGDPHGAHHRGFFDAHLSSCCKQIEQQSSFPSVFQASRTPMTLVLPASHLYWHYFSHFNPMLQCLGPSSFSFFFFKKGLSGSAGFSNSPDLGL